MPRAMESQTGHLLRQVRNARTMPKMTVVIKATAMMTTSPRKREVEYPDADPAG